jgi:hypothetical protein
VATLVAVTLLVGVNWVEGVEQMHERHAFLLTAQQCARHATGPQDPCLTMLYPRAEAVWPRLEYLRSIHWAGL